jgi:capsular polysaccharide biosynthesis protein
VISSPKRGDASSAAASSQPEAIPVPLPLGGPITGAAGGDLPKQPLYATRPLASVYDYAVANAQVMAQNAAMDALTEDSGSISALDAAWKSSPCYPRPYIAELDDVVVVPGSSILLTDADQALSDEIEQSFRVFGLPPKLIDIKTLNGPRLCMDLDGISTQTIARGIHLTKEHETNYFHWIVEILPRLFLLEQLPIDKRIPILVSEGLHDNLYALLDDVRDPARPVVKLQTSTHYRVRHLLYPSDLSRILDVYDRPPSTDTTYLPVDLLRAMVNVVKNAHAPISNHGGKRLFLRRGSTYRRLLNEAEIEQALVMRGFEAIDLNALSVDTQIHLFSQAEIVVGASGAGMTNILWCNPSARILVLHSDHPFKKYPYWDALARVSGARIDYLAGPRAFNVVNKYEAHDDYRIALQGLIDHLTVLPD